MSRNNRFTLPLESPGEVTFADYHDAPSGERKEIGRPLPPNWSNEKAALVGYMAGRGDTSREIAAALADGTSRETVRGMWRRWGLPIPIKGGRRCFILPTAMDIQTRAILTIRAEAAGVSPTEFIERVLKCVVRDDLYNAVVDSD
jgi:hypothetical protein